MAHNLRGVLSCEYCKHALPVTGFDEGILEFHCPFQTRIVCEYEICDKFEEGGA